MFDVYHRYRTDPAFAQHLTSLSHKLWTLERQGKATKARSAEIIAQIVRACNNNIGFIIPNMFPNYIDGAPLSLLNRPFGFAMTDVTPGVRFTTRAGRQAAKSTTIGAKLLTVAHMYPFRQMYLTPHHDQVQTFARRLREMERACRVKVNKSKYKQNDFYKEYPKGGIIELYNVYTDAVGIRGKTTDFLTIDEAQHFDGSLIPEVDQVMKATKFPVFGVSGTSLTIDTFLEAEFVEGSQATWVIPCPHVLPTGERAYLDTGDPDMVLKAIQPQGLTCPWTGRLLDPRNGFYVHRYPERLKDGLISIHVPQIIIPEYAVIPFKWKEIYDAFLEYDRSKFLQEVMGIPTEHGARELTEDELIHICDLGPRAEVQRKARQAGYYKFIVSGCDWGGSDYNRALKTKESYTVHAMVGVTRDNKIEIIHLARYSGMSYREVAASILSDHKRLGGTMMATDFGAGSAYNMLMRDPGGVPADRHVVFGYVGPKSAPVAVPSGDHMFNQFSLNRTEAVTELFLAIKKGRIRCYNWEEARPILSDFMNLIRAQKENEATGDTTLRFIRAGNKPDDGLHAVNFAYVLARLALQEPLVDDRGLQHMLYVRLFSRGGEGPFNMPDPIAG